MQYSNRLTIPQGPSFILRLVSYGHANGPLAITARNEKARLSFSVRDVPSPPAQLRRKHTGISARMKKEILASKASQGRLEQIREAIDDKMTELEEERSREPSPEPEAVLQGPEPPRELIVGIMCEEGKHRSVSFVEELSKDESFKRKNWDVKVEHRDLGMVDEEDEEESEEDVISPTDPKTKKLVDKRRKKMRSQSMRLDEDEVYV